jgi:leucyl-tRNA synthetase
MNPARTRQAVPYDPHEVERKWRARWEAAGLASIDLDAVDPDLVFYNLAEFPYPSAEGLHVGHVFKYCGLDAFGRMQRMRGLAVFQPMGFDAFGIHTENFALKSGENPKTLTARTTANFRRQLSSIGCAWDWRRVIDTSEPQYYRWTQWLLVQLFRAGLMYQAEAPVLWCPSCLTVLAREQAEEEGTRCERCSALVVEREMTQWFLRITAYADRLLEGLDSLEWPERAKRLQRAWIGRSEGSEIDFGDVTVFTTRPETLPAVTFLAVPPGHEAAGQTRPHPLTAEELPVVEADYVVSGYGSGAVMGVPAHDKRDASFATRHNLPTSEALLLSPEAAQAVGRRVVRYRLRDWLISRQRYWGPPIPIIHCEGCGPVPVPERDLPVVLPEVADFRPTGSGVSPLAAVASWVEGRCPACGEPARRETDVSDTFVDSAWYFLRYPSTDFTDRAWDARRTEAVLPVDFYAGGPEHVQRHHLYARFVTMALSDLGLVGFEEPFPRVRLGGFIVFRGAKMSKSKGNVVTPDEFLARHGSDVLRCALLFSAPWEDGGDLQLEAIAGIERFFARMWRQFEAPGALCDPSVPDDVELHQLVRDVADAIGRLRFNVGIARLMTYLPSAVGSHARSVFMRLLAPFAPHLAEELWARNGYPFSVHTASWPRYDASLLSARDVEWVVQVNGKVRERVRLPADATKDAVVRSALESAPVSLALGGRNPDRVVFVPGKLVNLVTVA